MCYWLDLIIMIKYIKQLFQNNMICRYYLFIYNYLMDYCIINGTPKMNIS